MPSQEPRFLLVSCRTFNGTTEDPGKYKPPLNGNEPRCIEVLPDEDTGRFPFHKLARPGTSGLIAYIRCHGEALGGDMIQVRSRKAGEGQALLPDDPPPLVDDALLESRPLTTTWSAPFLIGPTDAFAIIARSPRNVEFCLYDLEDEGFKSWLQSPAAAIAAAFPPAERRIITTTGPILPWAGLLYASAQIEGTNNVLTLPSASSMKIGDRMSLDRQGLDLFRVVPAAGDRINGLSDTDGARILFAEAHIGVIFERVDADGWFATADAQGLTQENLNTAAGIPVFEGDAVFNLTLAAAGTFTLPSTTLIGVGQRVTLNNLGPSGVQIVVADPLQETIDGAFGNNGGILRDVQLPLAGDNVVLERVGEGPGAGWKTVDNRSNLNQRTIDEPNVNVPLNQGWKGLRIYRLTNAAAATLTLPPFAVTPQGCEILVRGTQQPPTVTTMIAGEFIVGGGVAPATNVVLPDTNTWLHLIFNGAEWVRY